MSTQPLGRLNTTDLAHREVLGRQDRDGGVGDDRL
jgi:hypothetical protein